jgi:diguanylate cyclase (GGDEF)-like protein
MLNHILDDLAAVEQSAEEQRMQQVLAGDRLAGEIPLYRIKALRACCNAALRCADDDNVVARQQARTAQSAVEAWYDAILEKQRHTELLYTIAQSLHSSLDLDQVLSETLRLVGRALNAPHGSILLLDAQGQVWRKILFRPNLSTVEADEAVRMVLQDGLVAYTLRSGTVQIVTDASSDPRWVQLAGAEMLVGSAMALPLIEHHSKVNLGVLTLAHPLKDHFKPGMAPLAHVIAEQISTALTNAALYTRLQEAEAVREQYIQLLTAQAVELEALSLVDDLTDLYNRRGFTTLAEQQLKVSQHSNQRLWLLFADMDGLKQINDTQNHQAGSRALIDLAQLLKDSFREVDIIARLGGDEFVVLIEAESEPALQLMLHHFSANLDHFNRTESRPYRLAASIGVAGFDPEHPCTLEELIVKADLLMYADKRARKVARV